MQLAKDITPFRFLQGGGEMGRLIRTYDWASTSLGTPGTWPQSLKTTIGIILNSRFPMFLFWGEENLCFYNDAYRPSFGDDGKHPQALGSPAHKVWLEIWDYVAPILDQVKAGGEAVLHENELVPFYRNGRIEDIYWTFSHSAVLDEEGDVAGVLVTCIETTENVTIIQKLADNSDKLKFAIEAAEMGTWDYNPATNTFTGNQRLRDWFGLSTTGKIDLPDALAVIADKDRQRAINAIQTALDYASGGQYDIEYTIVHPATSQERIVRAQGRAYFGDDEVAYRFDGTMQDVTQQVLDRRRLEAEKERFHILLETMPNMAWTASPTGETTFINKRWSDYTGLQTRQQIDEEWKKIVHPDDQALSFATFDQAFAIGELYHDEYRLRRIDGEYRWHLARALPMRDNSDTIVRWVGTLTDIHEQKQLEAQLDQQVRQRTQQLEESVRDLKRSNENLQQFAYVASHDLQEPLRKIQSFGDILKKRFSAQLGEGNDYLNRMQSAATRMSILIEDLLTYSRISTKQEAVSDVPLGKVISHVLTNLELSIEEAEAMVMLEPLPTVQGDITQLTQLFQNLLSNALKFRQNGRSPIIRISTSRIAVADLPPHIRPSRNTPAYHKIDVADNGIGFEHKYLDRIFEVFQRLHGKSQYSGTGIGLAICEKVVANHGGAITAVSTPGSGATFSVYLPIL